MSRKAQPIQYLEIFEGKSLFELPICGRPDMAMVSFRETILNDKPIKIFNSGDFSRNFTCIDDVIDGVVAIIIQDSDKVLYSMII